MRWSERQITHGPGGRVLTNCNVWSPDSQWLVYDVRSDAAGDVFDGERIEMVHIPTGKVRVLYESRDGAKCGVATFHPKKLQVVFIAGPGNPTPEWKYNAFHRQGIMVDTAQPGVGNALDARDLIPPFTPGALRGGSHVHVWDPQGDWVSFTYEDHVLSGNQQETKSQHMNLRNIGVSIPNHPVNVPRAHPRNHSGSYFSVLVSATTAHPQPGSEQIRKACEEGWIGTEGYIRRDGTRQKRALAFQGHAITAGGDSIVEVFVADLPESLTAPGEGPLEGTPNLRPFPPKGVRQRRLTWTEGRKYPGLQGPRHWLRSSPDGTQIACLMKDDAGIVQLWLVTPADGALRQLTKNPWPIASTFTWSPDGRQIAHIADGSVCVTSVSEGTTVRVTPKSEKDMEPRQEACVFSPDGKQIAFVRRLPLPASQSNQICVVSLEP
jgi:hypothetical protein